MNKIKRGLFVWFLTPFFCVFFSFGLKAQEPLTLSECIEMALQQNIKIRISKLDVDRKENDLLQSKAALLPSLNGAVSQGFTFGNSLDYTTYQYVKDQTRSNYFQLSSDLTLFNGFSKINTIRSDISALEAGMYSYQDMCDQTTMQVAAAYLQILMNKEEVQLAEQQIELTKGLLEKTKILVEVGQETKSKELELNAELATNEVSLVEATNRLDQSYLQLKQLLNWEMSKPVSIATYSFDLLVFDDYSNINIEEVISKNVAELPKVKKAQADLESAQYSYKAANATKYPSLDLQSNLNTRYSSVKSPITGLITPFDEQLDNNFGQYFTIGLSIPIFNNLRTSHSVQLAKLNIKNYELSYKEVELQAKNSIYEAYYTMNSAYKKYLAAIKSQEAQRLLFDQSTLMYKEGMLNFYEWQSIRNNLSKSETALLSSKYDLLYKTKVFDYYRGKTVLLEK